MVQPEELRVGNLVYDKKHGHCRVHTINGGTGEVWGINNSIDLEQFEKDGEKSLAEKGEFSFSSADFSKYKVFLLKNITSIIN